MLSKEKILKGLDQQMDNLYCSFVDIDMEEVPIPNRSEIMEKIKAKINRIKELRKELEDLLI